jgi:hypothetical protein
MESTIFLPILVSALTFVGFFAILGAFSPEHPKNIENSKIKRASAKNSHPLLH